MADRVKVRYTYNSVEDFEQFNEQLREIIQQDTGEEAWIETRSLPPIGFSPPLSAEGVQKLKGLSGVRFEEIPDDE
ncbi:hypothetical protein FSOLCH5_013763 [Fusarium solani]|uniref:Uncharacterized protein n=1 Tax=Fusarium solani TaxID=169388 RepID=A0A9P9H9N5_FUSSL|nr:uncharacterized protein B0J15DRAFT_595386 [Fusarium solani]KAH7252908.1 hypothetical protein B0J15DRAFT_595386 [Fusarium solani]KAJ3459841.1 hypothetical protein MRS44_015914 [Fusarium solani]KAJ4212958.1 hypothetical protein NW759_011218 [Fusarium solani]